MSHGGPKVDVVLTMSAWLIIWGPLIYIVWRFG